MQYIGEIIIYTVTYFGLFTAFLFLFTLLDNKEKIRNPKPEKKPVVSVIIPCYNEEHTLTKTVESVLDLDYPREKLDIIIVDDGSTDNTLKVAKKLEQQGVRVFSKKNGGKGSALNYGIKKVRGEIVGSLDADSFVSKDALIKMLGYFKDERTMAVTPSLLVYKPENWIQKIQYIEFLFGILLRKIFALLGAIHVTPGPFTLFRKKFFDIAGGYDESTLTEDTEIAMRIQKYNYHIENSVDAAVYAVQPKTFKATVSQRTRWYVGFLENLFKYKHLLSRKHGYLGTFVLPSAIVSVVLILVLAVYSLVKFVDSSYKRFLLLRSVNWDFISLFNYDFSIFSLNFTTIAFLSIFSLSVAVFMMYLAKRLSGQRQKISIFYIIYSIFYWMFFAAWWVVALFCVLFKKRVAWGRKDNNESEEWGRIV